MKITVKLWIGMAVLIILSPLGLILPEYFKAGAAWGEWSVDEMQKLVGYIPQGLEKFANIWNSPMPDYAFRGWEEKGLLHMSFAYIASAIIGIGVIVLIVLGMGRFMTNRVD